MAQSHRKPKKVRLSEKPSQDNHGPTIPLNLPPKNTPNSTNTFSNTTHEKTPFDHP
jgi:hypothetical protein